MMYVLADCSLIHKYLIKKEAIKTIEDSTFFTVKILKELGSFNEEIRNNKLILSNGSEVLTFTKNEKAFQYFNYYLDEFIK
ncbi:MAG: hypothetical protein Q8936_08350 [Bacillota bacterium]|nr:hypothetical protein [Bacillota bacterium]